MARKGRPLPVEMARAAAQFPCSGPEGAAQPGTSPVRVLRGTRPRRVRVVPMTRTGRPPARTRRSRGEEIYAARRGRRTGRWESPPSAPTRRAACRGTAFAVVFMPKYASSGVRPQSRCWSHCAVRGVAGAAQGDAAALAPRERAQTGCVDLLQDARMLYSCVPSHFACTCTGPRAPASARGSLCRSGRGATPPPGGECDSRSRRRKGGRVGVPLHSRVSQFLASGISHGFLGLRRPRIGAWRPTGAPRAPRAGSRCPGPRRAAPSPGNGPWAPDVPRSRRCTP